MATRSKLCFFCSRIFAEDSAKNTDDSALVMFLCKLFALPVTHRVKLTEVTNSDFCVKCQRKLRFAMETAERVKVPERKLENIRTHLQQLFLLTATSELPEESLESESESAEEVSQVQKYFMQCLSHFEDRLVRLNPTETEKDDEVQLVKRARLSKIATMTHGSKLCFLCRRSSEEICAETSEDSPLVVFLCELFGVSVTDRVKLTTITNSDFCDSCKVNIQVAIETTKQLKGLELQLQDIRSDLQELFFLTATSEPQETEPRSVLEVRKYFVQCLGRCEVRLLRLSANELAKYQDRAAALTSQIHCEDPEGDWAPNGDWSDARTDNENVADENSDAVGINRSQESSPSPTSVILLDENPDYDEIEEVEPLETSQNRHQRSLRSRPRGTKAAKAHTLARGANSDSKETPASDSEPDEEDSNVIESQSLRSSSSSSSNSSDESESDDVEEPDLPEEPTSEPEKPRKKLGRPRKHPIEKPRKKLGRPRKHPIEKPKDWKLFFIANQHLPKLQKILKGSRSVKQILEEYRAKKPGQSGMGSENRKARKKKTVGNRLSPSHCVFCNLDLKETSVRRPEDSENADDSHPVDQFPYKCTTEDCTRVFRTMEKLRTHHERKCPQNPEVIERTVKKSHCTYCNLDLEANCRRQPQPGNSESDNDQIKKFPYKCPSEGCKHVFPTVGSLRTHHERKCPQRPKRVCPHCGSSFIGRSALQYHINSVHEKTYRFCCDKCGAGFQVRSGLETHVRLDHLDERNFVCEFCDKRFKTKSLLSYHRIARHTKEYPLMCEICGKGFIAKTKLRYHMELVHGKKAGKV